MPLIISGKLGAVNLAAIHSSRPIYQDISEGIYSPGIEYYLPLFFEKTATLFDYLPENTLIVSIERYPSKSKRILARNCDPL